MIGTLLFVTGVDVCDEWHILKNLFAWVTRTSHTVTCISMENAEECDKPQGSALNKQTLLQWTCPTCVYLPWITWSLWSSDWWLPHSSPPHLHTSGQPLHSSWYSSSALQQTWTTSPAWRSATGASRDPSKTNRRRRRRRRRMLADYCHNMFCIILYVYAVYTCSCN